MAVYERKYRPYAGPVTAERTRFLVLPRYAYRTVFASRLFVGFLGACMLYHLVLALLIYVPHNLSFLETLQERAGVDPATVKAMFTYGETFFGFWVLRVLMVMGFLVAFVVGPTLISSDLANNGLPLYLSRPFSRVEYILGKAWVMLMLLAGVALIPALLLFGLHAYLAGGEWLEEHGRIGAALGLCLAIWISLLCLITLALSAYVRWGAAARAALLGVFIVLPALGAVLNLSLGTSWGSLIDVPGMLRVLWAAFIGAPSTIDVPVWGAVGSLGAVCLVSLWLLARKVRAYEVVRG